jgi:hypothetical protein
MTAWVQNPNPSFARLASPLQPDANLSREERVEHATCLLKLKNFGTLPDAHNAIGVAPLDISRLTSVTLRFSGIGAKRKGVMGITEDPDQLCDPSVRQQCCRATMEAHNGTGAFASTRCRRAISMRLQMSASNLKESFMPLRWTASWVVTIGTALIVAPVFPEGRQSLVSAGRFVRSAVGPA